MVKSSSESRVRDQLRRYNSNKDRLLEVQFVSLADYLWLLRAACEAMQKAEKR